jgi:hypothetical protein
MGSKFLGRNYMGLRTGFPRFGRRLKCASKATLLIERSNRSSRGDLHVHNIGAQSFTNKFLLGIRIVRTWE